MSVKHYVEIHTPIAFLDVDLCGTREVLYMKTSSVGPVLYWYLAFEKVAAVVLSDWP